MQSPPHSVWPASPPPPRRAGVRPGNGRRRLSSSLAATVVVIALTSAALVLQRHDGPRQGSMIEQLDTLAWQLGLGLDQVEATGMRFTSDAAILDAVDMPNVRSFLSLDAAAVKRRIERLAWIDTARIERRLPNVLAIEVTERKPFAVWERGARDLLVDQGGRQLAAVARGAAPGLPRLVSLREAAAPGTAGVVRKAAGDSLGFDAGLGGLTADFFDLFLLILSLGNPRFTGKWPPTIRALHRRVKRWIHLNQPRFFVLA
jgi:cell division protein FtsQ